MSAFRGIRLQITSVSLVVVAIVSLVVDADPAVVLLQLRAGHTGNVPNSTDCKPPRTWLSEEELYARYTSEDIDNLTRANALRKRQGSKNERRTEYRVHDLTSEVEWISENQLRNKFDDKTIADMRRQNILLTHVNPGCPEWTKYYSFTHKVWSKEKLLQVFNQRTVEKLVKRGIITARIDTETPSKRLLLIDFRRLGSVVHSSSATAGKTYMETDKAIINSISMETCRFWCADHKDSWATKCLWISNACSGCNVCPTVKQHVDHKSWKEQMMEAAQEEADRQLKKMRIKQV